MERRFWCGLVLLVVFLILGIVVAGGMEKTHRPITACLEQAAEAALGGDLQQGKTLVQTAKNTWYQRRSLIAAVADHSPMEEIDSLFAQLDSYAKTGNAAEFAAWCSRAARLVEAVGQAHSLTWQNLL